jgi:glycosyltransferase involved in cell wall biosynthesis
MFGFVSHYKGHLTAVQALKKLPARFHLAIVGGPNLANPDMTFNSLLEAWEREDPRRLLVTGYASRETIELCQSATDICLAPYLPEFTSGSGAICLALSSDRPTIASNIPAFAAIQREADCLQLCTPNAVHELAWHIQRLAGNPELQQNLVQNAKKFVLERSWDRVTELLVDVYRDLTSCDTARSRNRPQRPPDPRHQSKSAA